MSFLPLIDIGIKLIDKIFPDPTKRAEAKALLLEQQQAGTLQEIESSMHVIIAEAKGGSWIQRSWRPIVMLVFTSLIVAKWLGFTDAGVTEEIEIAILEIIKVGIGGYIVGRSVEKGISKWKEK